MKPEQQQETVTELTPEMVGVWLVATQNSSHVWNLDCMTYERRPGPTASGSFPYDNEPRPISRVDAWPRVGQSSFVWFDDPSDPMFVEQYRISSVIRSITRLPDAE